MTKFIRQLLCSHEWRWRAITKIGALMTCPQPFRVHDKEDKWVEAKETCIKCNKTTNSRRANIEGG